MRNPGSFSSCAGPSGGLILHTGLKLIPKGRLGRTKVMVMSAPTWDKREHSTLPPSLIRSPVSREDHTQCVKLSPTIGYWTELSQQEACRLHDITQYKNVIPPRKKDKKVLTYRFLTFVCCQ